jgi:sigma-E factor negative regulatory protein RseC
MTQSAVVKRIIDAQTAEVEVTRGTACGGNCASCGGTCSFRNKLLIACSNPIGATVGEHVTIASQTRRILGAAALVYILPLVTFLIAYFIGAVIFSQEGRQVLVSLLGFVLGVAAVVVLQRQITRVPISFEIIARE